MNLGCHAHVHLTHTKHDGWQPEGVIRGDVDWSLQFTNWAFSGSPMIALSAATTNTKAALANKDAPLKKKAKK